MLSSTLSYQVVLVTLALVIASHSWNLKSIKISDTYYASSISLYRSRAFLTLPRTSCYNNQSNPTLVEVPWTGEYRDSAYNLMHKKRPYPGHLQQIWGDCKRGLQNVVSSAVEVKRGRLWILNSATEKCPSSTGLVVYNLHYNTEVARVSLEDKTLSTAGDMWSTLVLDSASGKLIIGGVKGRLLVVSVTSLKVWKVRLVVATARVTSRLPEGALEGLMDEEEGGKIGEEEEVGEVDDEEVEENEVGVDGRDGAEVGTEQLAISIVDPVMYLSGDGSEALYQMDLKWLRAQKTPVVDGEIDVNVKYLGNKLGASAGMTTDIKGGLNYYMIRDYAVLRWDTSKPLNAENHNVLAQSYDSLPYASCLFNGPQNGVWALINPLPPQTCTSVNRTEFAYPNETIPVLESRVVKILQYNRRSKKSFVFK